MDKNFAGQNLNGRSFRGQDLRGADFSGCQLKSCNFTNADLTNAKFCRAIIGINLHSNFDKLILVFLLSLFSGMTSLLFNFLFIQAATTTISKQVIDSDLLFSFSVFLSIYLSLKFKNWQIMSVYLLMILIVGTIVGVLTDERIVRIGASFYDLLIAAGTISVASAGVVALATVISIVATMIGRLSLIGAGLGALVGILLEVGSIDEREIATVMTFCHLFFGWYLNRRALQSEEPMLVLLRRNALWFRCWGGTQFSGAVLAHTDFTEADLTAARFSDAKFQQPSFIHAKNLHLAWTYTTPLERKTIRTLLTEHRIDERDFSNLNLRGLSFKGLNLSHCNFYHTDLSEADFSGCDLTEANFSEAMVYGASFNHAKMTGAIIDNWGMDKQTQFDGVLCEYVFTKREPNERNPPDGTFFKPGEFSKLYQEIANTVDFIAHSPDELQALLRAIDHIKQQGGDIVIQSLERKHESVVVRTQSHDGVDDATRYSEVIARKEKEMNLLQQEKQLLLQKVDLQAQHIDTFTQILSKAVEGPKIMNDHSRHYGNISAHNSAVSLGDASTVSNHIEKVADAELRTVLQDLQQLLANSHLPAIDKQEAHKAVNDLAAISQKPEIERKSLARRSLAFLKDLQKDLSSVAELGEQYGKLLVKVMAWF